jgi:hypothetical protein
MGAKKISKNLEQDESTSSNIYRRISKAIDYSVWVYIVLIYVTFAKNLDNIINIILIFLPLLLKNVVISIYEERANLKLFSKEHIEREKSKLEKQANLYIAMILLLVIELLLMREGEVFLALVFALTFLLPLLYFLIVSRRDARILMKAYELSRARRKSTRLKAKGKIKLK